MSSMSQSVSNSSSPVTIFKGRFTLNRLLGKGGFGEVYAGTQVSTGEAVAIKLEKSNGLSFLFHEARVMQDIQNSQADSTPIGIPILKYFGQEGDYRILIMSIHGPSLEDLHENLSKFSLKTTAMLAHQMITRLEFLHSVGHVHRDLKPDNFLMGVGNKSHIVYLIDYGLTTKFRESEGTHRTMATNKSFVGTSRYASLRTHQGFSQSRRDDIEQLAYILVFLYRARLPWSGLNIKDRDAKEKAIGEIKQKLPTSAICKDCPRQFEDLLIYARKMEFEEKPQYEMCRMLMMSVLEDLGPRKGKMDYQFDWVIRHKLSNSTGSVSSAARGSAAAAKPASGAVPASSTVPAAGIESSGQDKKTMPVTSTADAQGVLSGMGSGVISQGITSLGEK